MEKSKVGYWCNCRRNSDRSAYLGFSNYKLYVNTEKLFEIWHFELRLDQENAILHKVMKFRQNKENISYKLRLIVTVRIATCVDFNNKFVA